MKSVLILAAATAAYAATAATSNCVIPDRYVRSTASTCDGPRDPYLLYGYCVSGYDRLAGVAAPIPASAEVRVMMTDANTGIFTADGTNAMAPGCSVPSHLGVWTGAAGVPFTTSPISATTTLCIEMANPWTAAGAMVKGLDIQCNRGSGYYPVVGYEGGMHCMSKDGSPPWSANTNAAFPRDFFASPGVLDSLNTTLNDAGYAQFTGDNALLCAKGCALPESVCNNGRINAGITGVFNGQQTGTCTVLPTHATWPTWFTFQCVTGDGRSQAFTFTCTSDDDGVTTGAISPAYTGQCGSRDGATTFPIWNKDGSVSQWTGLAQTAGQITNFPSVTSTLQASYTLTLGAYATAFLRWNDNGAQALVDGTVYTITVIGCNQTGATRTQCVQQTLNWWRCYHNIPFNGGTICYANYELIACPTHENGFRCPSSSKKGLLGLLGLLGLIPLLLLCCCLLFLCCIRRRKTEADVHFATFDPHAAPVIATAPCATATACPTAFGATPFATHPSAIPCL